MKYCLCWPQLIFSAHSGAYFDRTASRFAIPPKTVYTASRRADRRWTCLPPSHLPNFGTKKREKTGIFFYYRCNGQMWHFVQFGHYYSTSSMYVYRNSVKYQPAGPTTNVKSIWTPFALAELNILMPNYTEFQKSDNLWPFWNIGIICIVHIWQLCSNFFGCQFSH